MAGQAHHGSRDRGHTSRHGSPSALAAAASEAGPGTEATITMASPAQAATPATPAAPSPRSVWRLLQMKGMTPDEAANLTAFLYGLPTADLNWTLPQLNKLLFLRQMRQTGRFGDTDGGSDLPH
jgi:hypothetical protein